VGTQDLNNDTVKARFKKRTTSVQWHAAIMGLSTLVCVPASMVTVTRWWGYVMLIPCIILAKWGNVIWRKRLGYTRLQVNASAPVDVDDMIKELEWTSDMQDVLRKDKKTNLRDYIELYRGQRVSHVS
jgi:hypothetical protein